MTDRDALLNERWVLAFTVNDDVSWMFDLAPIRIEPRSPRNTAPNQMLASSPTSTSPISTAVSATNALLATTGRRPLTAINVGMTILTDDPQRTLDQFRE